MGHTFFLTVPCQQAKQNPNEVKPVLVCVGFDNIGAALTKYICPFCETHYSSRRACEKHMGIGVMFSNVADIGCKVLRILGGEREKYVRDNFIGVKDAIEKRYITFRSKTDDSARKNRKVSSVNRKYSNKRAKRK